MARELTLREMEAPADCADVDRPRRVDARAALRREVSPPAIRGVRRFVHINAWPEVRPDRNFRSSDPVDQLGDPRDQMSQKAKSKDRPSINADPVRALTRIVRSPILGKPLQVRQVPQGPQPALRVRAVRGLLRAQRQQCGGARGVRDEMPGVECGDG